MSSSKITLGDLKVTTKSYYRGYPLFPLTFNLLVMIPQLASEIYFYIVNRCITKEPKYVSGKDFGLCWVWQGAKNLGRYGTFYLRYELPTGVFYVHVSSASKAMEMVTEFPEHVYTKGIITHHTCFDPECCNPEHLDIMTRSNHASLVSLSPTPKSTLNKSHKLHIKEKKIIKRMVLLDGWRIKDVAFHFRVTVVTIYNILKNNLITF